ncbi:P-loop containing nucleoside triphosphate hydrolase protein [Gonapodya prolifera JEL478]|uniref:p-loop containing nucleoside triphosphate hydrolase protein n=1 Tax=Gonapodya prolifera (strain JEL478) TaxID=1344416 RepID=A0A139ASF8_GONPJ|nr:P-loop containing nucleoside triphosphate hydrolase protein [Gonapodya prolifera JEL478]|eukprot:KXS19680.1 P-loop containing nucleoside triphosphate hydrolase protein [Gonapodya prolifera JEL478]
MDPRLAQLLDRLVPILINATVNAVERLLALAIERLARALSEPPQQPLNISAAVARASGSSVEELRSIAKQQLGINSISNWNIVVSGAAGVGKSTLLNAIVGLQNDDPGAAKTGVVETTTQTRTWYPYASLRIDDIPGYGTVQEPANAYFMRRKLYAYDMVILVFESRIYEGDVAIIQQCIKYQVPVVLVRSKTDSAIVNLRFDNPGMSIETAKQTLREKVIASVTSNITNVQELEKKLYFVSAHWIQGKLKHRGAFSVQRPIADLQMDEVSFLDFITATTSARRIETDDGVPGSYPGSV